MEFGREVDQRCDSSMPVSALTALMYVMAPGRMKHQHDLLQSTGEWHILLEAFEHTPDNFRQST